MIYNSIKIFFQLASWTNPKQEKYSVWLIWSSKQLSSLVKTFLTKPRALETHRAETNPSSTLSSRATLGNLLIYPSI